MGSYTLTVGWTEHRVTGSGSIESVGHTVRGEFPDEVPYAQAKAELRAICDRQEAEASERPGAAGGSHYRTPRTT